jgi:signal transduction histidine kinase
MITISVRIEQATGQAVVSVHDHGIGIPRDQQAQLFNRFARADNARKAGIGGTGLGLCLCRELVERQGGRIWFESDEGKGSTFYVSLPLYVE